MMTFLKKTTNKTLISKLYVFFKPKQKLFVIGLIFMFLGGIAQLSIPIIMGNQISLINGQNQIPEFFTILSLFSILLLQFFFIFLKDYFLSKFSFYGIGELKNKVYIKLINLPLEFYKTKSVGEYISIINDDVETVSQLFSQKISSLLYNIFIVIAATIIILRVDYKLSLLLFTSFGGSILLVYLFSKKLKLIARQAQEIKRFHTNTLAEYLSNVKTIRIFNSFNHEKIRYSNIIKEVTSKSIKNEVLSSVVRLLSMFFVMCSLLLVIWYAIMMVFKSEISSADILPVIVNLIYIINSISAISSFFTSLERTKGSTIEVIKILNFQEKLKKPFDNINVCQFNESIVFNNVSMSYNDIDEKVFSNVNFEILKGENIAIVGGNGSGKSTMINLILGLYEPKSGKVTLDNKNINTLESISYTKMFSVISQDVELFDLGVDENILYPNLELNIAKLLDIKKLLNINNLGTHTIGKNGAKLSGGQRQKISIARALYRDADIFILDEITNSLDKETIKTIYDVIIPELLRKNKTIISVTHNLSVIKSVDKVILINKLEGVITKSYKEYIVNNSA